VIAEGNGIDQRFERMRIFQQTWNIRQSGHAASCNHQMVVVEHARFGASGKSIVDLLR